MCVYLCAITTTLMFKTSGAKEEIEKKKMNMACISPLLLIL